ncbi:ArsA family ATPase [Haloarchaeobius amylolyticus]|uniref:ArsA family ATPase n=1 Tax=Haloarchaeobius amylolyticus TaxID=1198296 RepID=UPI00227103C6
MTRFVCYGGKGGVGKTTCAAATGLALAGRGHRVLVVSTDPAHSLGDAFDTTVGGEPRELADGCWGVEVSPETGQAAYRRVVEALVADFREAGLRIDEETLEELFAAGLVPGADEVAALEHIADYAASDDWDHVVLDTAPTGHTLRLLDLPEVLASTLGAAGEVRGQVRRLVDSARSAMFGPAAFFGRDRDAPDAVADLRDRLDDVSEVLRDPERTEFRPVLVPEAMAIAETERLVDQLAAAEVPVGTIVVNRVLEADDCDCHRCTTRRQLHEERLADIRERFPDRELCTLPVLDGEAQGRDALDGLARRLDATFE